MNTFQMRRLIKRKRASTATENAQPLCAAGNGEKEYVENVLFVDTRCAK